MKLRRKMRKNNREKQRRSELNRKFDKLCSVLHLAKKTKTEKFIILTEAINLISQLRQENNGLRMEKQELRMEVLKLTTCLNSVFQGQKQGMRRKSQTAIPQPSMFYPPMVPPPNMNVMMPPMPEVSAFSNNNNNIMNNNKAPNINMNMNSNNPEFYNPFPSASPLNPPPQRALMAMDDFDFMS